LAVKQSFKLIPAIIVCNLWVRAAYILLRNHLHFCARVKGDEKMGLIKFILDVIGAIVGLVVGLIGGILGLVGGVLSFVGCLVAILVGLLVIGPLILLLVLIF
jgi:phage-related protein